MDKEGKDVYDELKRGHYVIEVYNKDQIEDIHRVLKNYKIERSKRHVVIVMLYVIHAALLQHLKSDNLYNPQPAHLPFLLLYESEHR